MTPFSPRTQFDHCISFTPVIHLNSCCRMLLTRMLRAADHPYLMGKGGRMPNNDPSLLQGLTLKSLKHHVALQPLFVIMGAGIIFVGAYIGRLVNCTSIYLTKTVTLDSLLQTCLQDYRCKLEQAEGHHRCARIL